MNSAMGKIITKITENWESSKSKRGLFWKFARLCPAQAKDDKLQVAVLSCFANHIF